MTINQAMDKTMRDIIISKLGTLMLANTELAAENARLIALLQSQAEEIAALKGAKDKPADSSQNGASHAVSH